MIQFEYQSDVLFKSFNKKFDSMEVRIKNDAGGKFQWTNLLEWL